MEAWEESDQIPAIKVINYVDRVKTEKLLAKAALEVTQAGFTPFYEGGPDSIEEHTEDGMQPVTRYSEAVESVEELPEDVEFVAIKAAFGGNIRYTPIRFVKADEAETTNGEAVDLEAKAKRERRRARLKALESLASSRPGMSRVDVMLAEGILASATDGVLTATCRVLGIEVDEYSIGGHNVDISLPNAGLTLIDHGSKDKRTMATIAITAMILELSSKDHSLADEFLGELVEDYTPDPF
jgi:hypothetical protein